MIVDLPVGRHRVGPLILVEIEDFWDLLNGVVSQQSEIHGQIEHIGAKQDIGRTNLVDQFQGLLGKGKGGRTHPPFPVHWFAGDEVPMMLTLLGKTLRELTMAAAMERVQRQNRKRIGVIGEWHGHAGKNCCVNNACGCNGAGMAPDGSGFSDVLAVALDVAGRVSRVDDEWGMFDDGIVIEIGMIGGDQDRVE